MQHVNRAEPKPVVVVPVHRPYPSADEQFGLKRCGAVLAGHPIQIVHPMGLDLSSYRDLLPTASPLPVPPAWMASINAYNRMMVNPNFYAMFSGFSHLLIHEPDALVLEDELLSWCHKRFDYIGAPWFENWCDATPDAPILGVGNSGFSLMRVESILQVFTSRHRWLKRTWVARQLIKKFLGRQIPHSYFRLLQYLGSAGSLKGAHRVMNEHCDSFLCRNALVANPRFCLASVDEALRFSWEVNPRICCNLNNGRSPFGIHAWARYDRAFIESLLEKTWVGSVTG